MVRPVKGWQNVDAFTWSVRDGLPQISIPLFPHDGSVPIDLQSLFSAVYDRSGYDYSLDYTRPVIPPLNESDALWVKQLLSSRSARD
jgi:hypothetical protein